MSDRFEAVCEQMSNNIFPPKMHGYISLDAETKLECICSVAFPAGGKDALLQRRLTQKLIHISHWSINISLVVLFFIIGSLISYTCHPFAPYLLLLSTPFIAFPRAEVVILFDFATVLCVSLGLLAIFHGFSFSGWTGYPFSGEFQSNKEFIKWELVHIRAHPYAILFRLGQHPWLDSVFFWSAVGLWTVHGVIWKKKKKDTHTHAVWWITRPPFWHVCT